MLLNLAFEWKVTVRRDAKGMFVRSWVALKVVVACFALSRRLYSPWLIVILAELLARNLERAN